MHPFSTCWLKTENLTVFWCFQGVEKGCTGKKWVKIGYTLHPSKNSFFLLIESVSTQELSSLIWINVEQTWCFVSQLIMQVDMSQKCWFSCANAFLVVFITHYCLMQFLPIYIYVYIFNQILWFFITNLLSTRMA